MLPGWRIVILEGADGRGRHGAPSQACAMSATLTPLVLADCALLSLFSHATFPGPTGLGLCSSTGGRSLAWVMMSLPRYGSCGVSEHLSVRVGARVWLIRVCVRRIRDGIGRRAGYLTPFLSSSNTLRLQAGSMSPAADQHMHSQARAGHSVVVSRERAEDYFAPYFSGNASVCLASCCTELFVYTAMLTHNGPQPPCQQRIQESWSICHINLQNFAGEEWFCCGCPRCTCCSISGCSVVSAPRTVDAMRHPSPLVRPPAWLPA